MAVDKEGNLYIADTSNNAIKKLDTLGNLTTIASELNSPTGIAIVPISGGLFVSVGNELIFINKKEWTKLYIILRKSILKSL